MLHGGSLKEKNMEEFLQRTRDCLVTGEPLQHVHAVLGDKTCDLDSITATLTYAYYLAKQVNQPNALCVPVLNIQRRDFFLHTETGLIVDHLKIPSECLIFRDEIDLQQLSAEGKLTLTLISSNVLTSDDRILESAVVKVIGPPEFISTASSSSYALVVLKEILQKAPDLVTWELALLLRGVVLLTCSTSERENFPENYEETLSLLEDTFPELPSREEYFSEMEMSNTKPKVPGLSMEQILLKDVKELSDGEIKVAISSVYMTHEDNIIDWIDDLKAFIDKYDYEALIILTTYVQDGSRKIVVHTENLELGSQICCELEESQNPWLQLDPLEYDSEDIQIYQQLNLSPTFEQITYLIKDVLDRRRPEAVSNSRTSSTEAVAGSAQLSQGSSDTTDLCGSDIEPQPSSAVNFVENPQDLSGAMPGQIDVNIDLVSPDSGLATIRSSRSSKESSVFLSDDSPVAEAAGLHYGSLHGFDPYSAASERRMSHEQELQSHDINDGSELYNSDSLSTDTAPSDSIRDIAGFDMMENLFLATVSSNRQPSVLRREHVTSNSGRNNRGNYSPQSLTAESEEASPVDYENEFNHEPEDHLDRSEISPNLSGFADDDSSLSTASSRRGDITDTDVPPTPVNSLVDSSPLDSGPPRFFPQDVIAKINEIGHAHASQSVNQYPELWGDCSLGSKHVISQSTDTQGGNEHMSLHSSRRDVDHQGPILTEFEERSFETKKEPTYMISAKLDLWDNQFSTGISQSNNVQSDMDILSSNVEIFESQFKSTEKQPSCSQLNTSYIHETGPRNEYLLDLWNEPERESSLVAPNLSNLWNHVTEIDKQLSITSYSSWSSATHDARSMDVTGIWNQMEEEANQGLRDVPTEWPSSKTNQSVSFEEGICSALDSLTIQTAPDVASEGHCLDSVPPVSEEINIQNESIYEEEHLITRNQDTVCQSQSNAVSFGNSPIWGDIQHTANNQMFQYLLDEPNQKEDKAMSTAHQQETPELATQSPLWSAFGNDPQEPIVKESMVQNSSDLGSSNSNSDRQDFFSAAKEKGNQEMRHSSFQDLDIFEEKHLRIGISQTKDDSVLNVADYEILGSTVNNDGWDVSWLEEGKRMSNFIEAGNNAHNMLIHLNKESPELWSVFNPNETTTSYRTVDRGKISPENLHMWNTTICEESQSTATTPDTSGDSGADSWNWTNDTSHPSHILPDEQISGSVQNKNCIKETSNFISQNDDSWYSDSLKSLQRTVGNKSLEEEDRSVLQKQQGQGTTQSEGGYQANMEYSVANFSSSEEETSPSELQVASNLATGNISEGYVAWDDRKNSDFQVDKSGQQSVVNETSKLVESDNFDWKDDQIHTPTENSKDRWSREFNEIQFTHRGDSNVSRSSDLWTRQMPSESHTNVPLQESEQLDIWDMAMCHDSTEFRNKHDMVASVSKCAEELNTCAEESPDGTSDKYFGTVDVSSTLFLKGSCLTDTSPDTSDEYESSHPWSTLQSDKHEKILLPTPVDAWNNIITQQTPTNLEENNISENPNMCNIIGEGNLIQTDDVVSEILLVSSTDGKISETQCTTPGPETTQMSDSAYILSVTAENQIQSNTSFLEREAEHGQDALSYEHFGLVATEELGKQHSNVNNIILLDNSGAELINQVTTEVPDNKNAPSKIYHPHTVEGSDSYDKEESMLMPSFQSSVQSNPHMMDYTGVHHQLESVIENVGYTNKEKSNAEEVCLQNSQHELQNVDVFINPHIQQSTAPKEQNNLIICDTAEELQESAVKEGFRGSLSIMTKGSEMTTTSKTQKEEETTESQQASNNIPSTDLDLYGSYTDDAVLYSSQQGAADITLGVCDAWSETTVNKDSDQMLPSIPDLVNEDESDSRKLCLTKSDVSSIAQSLSSELLDDSTDTLNDAEQEMSPCISNSPDASHNYTGVQQDNHPCLTWSSSEEETVQSVPTTPSPTTDANTDFRQHPVFPNDWLEYDSSAERVQSPSEEHMKLIPSVNLLCDAEQNLGAFKEETQELFTPESEECRDFTSPFESMSFSSYPVLKDESISHYSHVSDASESLITRQFYDNSGHRNLHSSATSVISITTTDLSDEQHVNSAVMSNVTEIPGITSISHVDTLPAHMTTNHVVVNTESSNDSSPDPRPEDNIKKDILVFAHDLNKYMQDDEKISDNNLLKPINTDRLCEDDVDQNTQYNAESSEVTADDCSTSTKNDHEERLADSYLQTAYPFRCDASAERAHSDEAAVSLDSVSQNLHGTVITLLPNLSNEPRDLSRDAGETSNSKSSTSKVTANENSAGLSKSAVTPNSAMPLNVSHCFTDHEKEEPSFEVIPVEGSILQPVINSAHDTISEFQVSDDYHANEWDVVHFGDITESELRHHNTTSEVHTPEPWEDMSNENGRAEFAVPKNIVSSSCSQSIDSETEHQQCKIQLEIMHDFCPYEGKVNFQTEESFIRRDNLFVTDILSNASSTSILEVSNESLDIESMDGSQTKTSPELLESESEEDVRLQLDEDQTINGMGYIVISGGEGGYSAEDILEQGKHRFTLEETNNTQTQHFREASSVSQPNISHPLSAAYDNVQSLTAPECMPIQKMENTSVSENYTSEKSSSRTLEYQSNSTVLVEDELLNISPEENSSETESTENNAQHSFNELDPDLLNQELDQIPKPGLAATVVGEESSEVEEELFMDNLTEGDETVLVFNEADTSTSYVCTYKKGKELNHLIPEDGSITISEQNGCAADEKQPRRTIQSIPEDEGMDFILDDGVLSSSATESKPVPPNSLDLNGVHPRKKKLAAPDINLSLDHSEGSVLSDDNLDTPDDLDINVDDLDTPDEADSLEYTGQGNELEWEEDQPVNIEVTEGDIDAIPEYTAEEERADNRLWRTVLIGEQEHKIDMKVIDPYKKVLSHGGYYGEGASAIIVFAACFLPDSSRPDYHYVMENLFLYVISTLELMVAEDYMIVYLNGATPRRQMPGLGWMKKCYQMIDRRLRKNLKSFIIVHPSWFIRTILAVTRPFISSKFSSKIKYVSSLAELAEMIPMEYVHIPEVIIQIDKNLQEKSKS